MTPADIERAAMANTELPEGITGPEQLLFLSFRSRCTRRQIRNGYAEQGKREKSRLLKEYGTHDVILPDVDPNDTDAERF
jgi:hypothetical protein